MNNREAASLALKRAEVIFNEAESLRAKGVWNLVVRRAQEAVELALKGALLWAGLAVPWVHDVGAFLRQNRRRFLPEFARQIPRLASLS
ncbi:MAG: HEPN domain-containing protein, partial [Anaerolineae bacterium]|nr:HEPN domain-containing protein [Anaerolineae bacterium]